jgi:flagellar biosynthesis protein FliR
MISLQVSYPQVQMFLLVFLRVTVIMMSLPIFSGNNVPNMFKAGLSLAVALTLFPVIDLTVLPAMTGWIFMTWASSAKCCWGWGLVWPFG